MRFGLVRPPWLSTAGLVCLLLVSASARRSGRRFAVRWDVGAGDPVEYFQALMGGYFAAGGRRGLRQLGDRLLELCCGQATSSAPQVVEEVAHPYQWIMVSYDEAGRAIVYIVSAERL
ncbi:hypothetical protein ACWCYK_30595 [Streptomyces lydicamycinicus]|uniref:hypothetical protein n=1 Tax=Streptomyces lydicamycinicus TaxID=1546107 RepID=UPI003C2B382C